jgi:general secretion pathway protein L
MMFERRVLGLDIGTSAVKVVQLKVRRPGRKTITRLAICGGVEELNGLLADAAWWRPSDQVHLSFPSDRVVMRRIALPFKDPVRIQQTLPFQLEGEVPFPVEEMAAGYLLQGSRSDGTELMAVVSTREAVREWLAHFRPMGLDPVALEPEIAALSHLVPKALGDPPATFAVVDMGATKVNLLAYHEGRIRGLRTIANGVGYDEAALPLPEIILLEIHRSLRALQARGDAPWPEAVYLCGGGAAIPGVAAWLADRWGIPVNLLTPTEGLPCALEEMPDIHPSRFSTAIGLALGQRRRHGGLCNLRVGDLAYHPGLTMFRGRTLAASVLFLLALSAGLADLQTHLAVKRRTREALVSEMRALFRQVSPEASQIVDPALQMRRILDERRSNQLNLLVQDPRGSAVEILREISLRTQASAVLRLKEFDLQGNIISIRGEADGYSTIENAKDRWRASSLLEDVEIKSAKKNPKTQLWEFQCTARRKFS